jgi:hypothetical protein
MNAANHSLRFVRRKEQALAESAELESPCVYPAIVTSVTWIDGADVVRGKLTQNEVAVGEEFTFAYDKIGNGSWHDATLIPHLKAGDKIFVRLYAPPNSSPTVYTYKLVVLFQTLEGGDLVYVRPDATDGWIKIEVDGATGEPRLVHGDPQTVKIDTSDF